MVGFLVTAKSILLSINDKWIVQRSREAGAYEMLIGYMISATYWWLAAAIASALGIAVTPSLPLPEWQRPIAAILFSCWTFVAMTACLSALRVLTIFSVILRSLSR